MSPQSVRNCCRDTSRPKVSLAHAASPFVQTLVRRHDPENDRPPREAVGPVQSYTLKVLVNSASFRYIDDVGREVRPNEARPEFARALFVVCLC